MTKYTAQYIEKYVAIVNSRSHAHTRKDKNIMKSVFILQSVIQKPENKTYFLKQECMYPCCNNQ